MNKLFDVSNSSFATFLEVVAKGNCKAGPKLCKGRDYSGGQGLEKGDNSWTWTRVKASCLAAATDTYWHHSLKIIPSSKKPIPYVCSYPLFCKTMMIDGLLLNSYPL